MTAQEVFDTVAVHLLTQNAKSMRSASGTECAYRGSNGLRCAAGVLIPDEAYCEGMEGIGCFGVDRKYPGAFPNGQLDLIYSMQILHDEQPPEEWKDGLLGIAGGRGLDPSVVTNFKA